jgi:hypothetical protein
VVFGLYLIGIAVAVLTGLMLKNSILKGEATPFIMELPPYHLPTVKGILIHTWDRLRSFMFRAGRVIVPMVLVLNFLNAVGTDGSFGNEDSDKSMLAEVGRAIAPAFSPMGLNEENWPAAVGIFTGVLAKEAVVGTLDAAYTALAESDAAAAGEAPEDEEAFNLGDAVAGAFATIPANLATPWVPGPIRSDWMWATSATRPPWPRNRKSPPAPSAPWPAVSTAPPGPSPTCCSSCSTSPAPPPSLPYTRNPALAGPLRGPVDHRPGLRSGHPVLPGRHLRPHPATAAGLDRRGADGLRARHPDPALDGPARHRAAPAVPQKA